MHIGVGQAEHEAAGPTLAAGLGAWHLTEDQLSDPEPQSLLSDPLGAGDENDLGELAIRDGTDKTTTGHRVTRQRLQRHGKKVSKERAIGTGIRVTSFSTTT
jgi:hypothetical protein